MKRNHSAIEILRIFLLLFLVATHWSPLSEVIAHVDTKIIWTFSFISVTCFGLITGMFVFRKRSLVYRNFSRLIFIIVVSILIMLPMLSMPGFNLDRANIMRVFSGSAYIWYIYAIIPVYFIGPLIYKWMNRTASWKLLLIGVPLFAAGAVTSQIGDINGYQVFYFEDFGLIFSISFLMGLAFIGFTLKRLCEKKWKHKKLTFILITLLGTILLELFSLLNLWPPSHGNIFITITSIGILGFCYQINWYSKPVNWLVKRLYFVYEYHWYWHMLYGYLFSSFAKSNPHASLYLNWVLVFGLASFVSIAVTEIQIHIWIRFVDPPVLKLLNAIKRKVFKSTIPIQN